VEAVPDAGYHFAGWSDGLTGNPRADSNVASDLTVTANFRIYSLAASSGSGGSVTRPGEGTFAYEISREVEVQARPDEGWHFLKWTGTAVSNGKIANASKADTVVTVDGEYDLKALFAYDSHTLTVSSTSGGSVTNPGEGEVTYTYINLATIEATAEEHYHFAGWTGTAVAAGSVWDTDRADTVVLVDADYTLRANFEADSYTLTYNAGVNGSISGPTPQAVAYGSDGAAVTAVPAPGYRFAGWSDGSTDNPRIDRNVNADVTVTANFVTATHTLTTSSTAGGSVTTPGEETREYDYGQVVKLVAIPKSGYCFAGWTGPVADPMSKITTVTITGDVSVQAAFKAKKSPPE